MLSASFYTKIGLLSISEAKGSIVSLNWEEKDRKRKKKRKREKGEKRRKEKRVRYFFSKPYNVFFV